MEDINIEIDKITIWSTHYDFARLLHKMHKDNYRYYGKCHWKYYDPVDKIWKHDKRSQKLKSIIRINISDMFLGRYFYWYAKSVETTDGSDRYTYQEKARELQKISYNLKIDKFISTVIKEARCFFDFHNYED